MPRLRVSAEALANVKAISSYISQHRPAVARRVGAKLYKTFVFLSHNPHVGTARDDIRPGLRLFVPGRPARRYLVFFQYRPADDIVEITAVIDSARDWPTMLRDPGN